MPVKRRTQETDAGLELLCTRCNEFWPADAEFFQPSKRDGFASWCKACVKEDPKEQARRARSALKYFANKATSTNTTSPTY